jgi:thymidylate synthase (FAD)
MKVVASPRVTIISRPLFLGADHIPFLRSNDNNHPQDLVEFAGRLCYLSFGAGELDGHKMVDGRKSAFDYHQNILKQAHGSVLEHANFSFLFEGISRSLTHELVRHRAGFAYSQLSQRFVKAEDMTAVLPPAIKFNTTEYSVWHNAVEAAFSDYVDMVDLLSEAYGKESKQVREAARSVLPNCAETKIVVTGNIRAWRNWLEMRGALGADAEIRRLAVTLLPYLKAEAPHLFHDINEQRADGVTHLVSTYRKV